MNPRQASELVARLLGPAAPEVGGDECFEHIDAYVEAQLDADALYPGEAGHLEGCPACREERESLRAYLLGR